MKSVAFFNVDALLATEELPLLHEMAKQQGGQLSSSLPQERLSPHFAAHAEDLAGVASRAMAEEKSAISWAQCKALA